MMELAIDDDIDPKNVESIYEASDEGNIGSRLDWSVYTNILTIIAVRRTTLPVVYRQYQHSRLYNYICP